MLVLVHYLVNHKYCILVFRLNFFLFTWNIGVFVELSFHVPTETNVFSECGKYNI